MAKGTNTATNNAASSGHAVPERSRSQGTASKGAAEKRGDASKAPQVKRTGQGGSSTGIPVQKKPASSRVNAQAARTTQTTQASARAAAQAGTKAKPAVAQQSKAQVGTKSNAVATPKPKATVSVKVAGSGRSRQQPSADEAETRAKARKGALFLAAVVVAYVVFLVLSGQMGTFIEALGSVDMQWVWGAFICYGMYFVFGVLAYVIAVYIDHDSPVGVRDLMSVEASGVFFGNLTPMAAGSVPSQIVRLTRTGLDPGEASATQFTRFIMFQLGVVLFAALMLAAKLEFFFSTYGDILIFNLIVFSVHLLELVLLFVICLCPKLVMRAGNWGIKFLSKHNLIKDETVKSWSNVINVQVMEFSNAFKRAMSDWPSMALTLLVTMCQLACLYMIPWFVLRAFGRSGDFLECLAAGSMVEMVTSAVPLPGGTGGAEGSFLMFYGHMFGEAASAGFIVWRIAEFFLPTLLAVPLLGLRTKNRSVSIYHRVRRLRAKLLGEGGGNVAPVAAYKPKKHSKK